MVHRPMRSDVVGHESARSNLVPLDRREPLTRVPARNLARVEERALTCANVRTPSTHPPGLTPQGERIRGRPPASFLPCSTRRKELVMSVADQLGRWQETNGVLAMAGQGWGHLANIHPALPHCCGVRELGSWRPGAAKADADE